jgi:RHS repeat-associated protein
MKATTLARWLGIILILSLLIGSFPSGPALARPAATMDEAVTAPLETDADTQSRAAPMEAVVPAAAASQLISITPSGFQPASVTVDSGMEVVWQNNTSKPQVLRSGQPYSIYLPLIMRGTSRAAAASLSAARSAIAPQSAAADDFVATIQPSGTFTHTFITEGAHPYYLVSNMRHRGQVSVVAPIPPDPVDVAPPVDPTLPTTVISATEFLYTGPNPIQTGVISGTIEARRVAVLRGRVLTQDGAALPGVTITVLDHPEFGQTLSRADGMFDLAVNGGGLLTVNYEKVNFLPAQRQVQTPWEDYVWLDDVVLIGLDANVTAIDLTATTPMQVALGSIVTDDDGTRQATVMIPQGTTAELVLPDGSIQPVTTLHVRATEYTAGDAGPEAMPAELPAQSGYTYAVELSADEAIAAGASDVRFSQPLYFYVENFLDFPVGGIVPAGYYDSERGAWIPSENGRIIAIVSITGGLADVDTDGDGAADPGGGLGITDAERQELAARFTVGQSLWRVPVRHFTPWDCNWPYGPPPDAKAPNQPDPDADSPDTDDPCRQGGSIIECESQTLREAIPIAGTPFTLHYGSDRVPGRTAEQSLEIPLSGASIPPSLKRIELEINVAGRRFSQTLGVSPNLSVSFTWDGLDAYGRAVQGRQPVSTKINYAYDAVYMQPAQFGQAFGQYSGVPITGNRARQEVELGQEWQGVIGSWEAKVSDLAAWSLDIHHIYDAQSGVLHQGNGQQRRAENLSAVITTVAGNGAQGYGGDGGPATQASLNYPGGITHAPDGSLYIADYYNHRVRRVGLDGIITTVAGNGNQGYSGDGGPATQAELALPYGLDVARDGSLYIADQKNHRIRRVGLDGIITTVAGNGTAGFDGDGGPATQAKLYEPVGIVLSPDGSLYIADHTNQRIRRVGPDGIITTVAGTGSYSYGGDGGLATLASFRYPYSAVLQPNGSFYIGDHYNHRVRRVGPDGIITTVAGTGNQGYSGDGGLATQAMLNSPGAVGLSPDGSLYIPDSWNHRVRRVGPDGIITTVAGNGSAGYGGDNGPATQAQLYYPSTTVIGPDGSLYISDPYNHRIRRLAPPPAGTSYGDVLIPSDDGQQLYVFDPAGRHLRTLHALTGAVLYRFTYDGSGLLASVIDGDGNTTTIERDGSGQPAAIVAPFGQRTQLTLDPNGYLSDITNPAGETIQFTYSAGGLMTSMTDARNGTHSFSYDDFGRLVRDEDPAHGAKTLSRIQSTQGYSVTVTSAVGRQTSYSIERRPVGGTIRRTTAPDGTVTQSTIGTDGSTATLLPDGTKIDLLEGPDPRFGMQAALPKSRTVTTPGGKVATTTTNRTVTLTSPDDILSLTGMTDSVTVNGRTYTSAYDAASSTFTDTSPAGRTRTTTIDGQGRVTRTQSAGLEPTAYAYDAHGRLASITQGTGGSARVTQFTYNSAGYLASIVDPLNRTVQFAYDAAGRVTQQVLPGNRTIAYAYDPNGNVTSLAPPGRPGHAFTYTPTDLEATYDPPDIGLPLDVTANTYNLDRQVTRISLPTGQNLDFAYDATTGKLSGLTFSRGTTGYGYSATTGQLTSIVAPGGVSLAFGYDGSLLLQESWTGPAAGSVGRTYDNDFRITGLNVNGTGTVAYQYDADSLLTQAGALTLTRDPQNGLLTGTTLGSVADSWSYNGFGEPSAYAATYGGNAVYGVQFTRDALGRITGKSETIGGVTVDYGYDYDVAGRLSTVRKNGSTTATYTYDVNGNRLTYTGAGGTVNGAYDAQDRLMQYGAATYAYTADGRLLSKTAGGQTTSYQYDEMGNLMAVAQPGQPQIDYLVDGNNRRIGKQVGGTLVQGFLYQNGLNPIAELDGAGNVVSRFVYGARANVPEYMIRGGTTYRIIADHLGSPRLVIDTATGAVAHRLDYDEFGRVLADTNPGFQPFGFAGGLYDADTGLVRFGARDYDAVTGRWTGKDPIRFRGGGVNLYLYVYSDPINFIDPSGLQGSLSMDTPAGPPGVSTSTGSYAGGPEDSGTLGGNYVDRAGNAVREAGKSIIGELLIDEATGELGPVADFLLDKLGVKEKVAKFCGIKSAKEVKGIIDNASQPYRTRLKDAGNFE